jgi:hypothetical protein
MQTFQYQPQQSPEQGDNSNFATRVDRHNHDPSAMNKVSITDYPPFGESEEDCCLQNPGCGCVCTCANNDAPLKFGKKQLRITATVASILFIIVVNHFSNRSILLFFVLQAYFYESYNDF